MEKNNSELYDINIPQEYFNKLIQISEHYLNYVTSYNSLTKEYVKGIKNIHKIFDEKIKEAKNELQNNKKIDLSYLFLIVNSLPNINYSYLENQQFFIKGVENSIKALKKYIDEKKILVSKFLQNLNDTKQDLLIKINDIEKEKNIFFNSLTQTEKHVSEFYANKLKIEDYSKEHNNINNLNNGKNNNSNELKNLFLQNTTLEEQMNKSINESKNLEKNYISLITNSKIFKKSFVDSSNINYENIRNSSMDIFIELKKFIENIVILQKNCYAIPLKEIDSNLSKLILIKKEENTIIKKFSSSDITIEDNYPVDTKKYSLFSFKNNTDNNISNNTKKNNQPFIKIEDGIEQIILFENDIEFMTAKTMFNSFSLINNEYNINFDVEEEKRNTRKIISNLLLNIEKKYKKSDINKMLNKDNNIIYDEKNDIKNDDNKELKYVHENDIQILYNLLDKHYNRAIFLHTISQFRTSGKYCMPLKVFEILGKCLIIIIDTILRDEDYHCARSAIILSQTYFRIDKNKRCYLHTLIKDNKLFKNMEFWKKTLEVSILKEIIKNKKININNKKFDNNKIEKNESNIKNEINDELSDDKYSDIAFGQIASIVNSMIDFDINIKDIRSIIEPNIKLYKLNQNQRNNIELVINSKLNLDQNENTIQNNDNNNNNKDKNQEKLDNDINSGVDNNNNNNNE